MAESNASDFILSLIGELDEATTKKNVQNALDKISKSVTVKSNSGKGSGKDPIVKLYNKEDLEKQRINFISTVDNVEKEIRRLYQPIDGKINITGIQDATGAVVKYTAEVTKANQVVNRFNLERVNFSDGTAGFLQTSGGFADKGFGTILTRQLGELRKAKAELENIMSNYITGNGNNVLSNSANIDSILTKLIDAESLINKLNSNAGYNSIEKMTNLKSTISDIRNVADEYLNLERVQQNYSDKLSQQKYKIEDYNRALNKINETVLNSNSNKSLVNADGVDSIIQKYNDLRRIVNDLQKDNSNGNTIKQDRFREVGSLLKTLNQDINILRGNINATFDADTSQSKLSQDIAVQKQRIATYVTELQRAGLYTGNLKTEMISLIQSLSNIKTPKDLDSYKAKLAQIQEQAKRTGMEMQNTLASDQLNQKLKIFSSQVVGYMQQNSRAVIQFKSQFDKIKLGINSASSESDLLKLQNEFKLLQQNINNAGKAGLTFGERMSAAVKKFMMWTGMTNTVMYLIRSIRQMINNTKELDSAMISLKKVTDETDATYARMFDTATNKAKELNTSIKNIIDSTAEFAKLGFSTSQAEQLAEIANVYSNVGELDIQSATESLVSTINGFKNLNADDAWRIIDEFNNVGNKFSISSAGIGEALKRSAASLSESNASLEESIALITTANSVIQDPEKVGTALRTVSLRIRGAKAELEEAGLETENMVESTAKLRNLIMGIADVDILEADEKTFKSPYEILLQIGKKWKEIDNEVQKSALLEAIAGKMQSNIVASILNNSEMLESVFEQASNSAGSAMQEQERWATSLEAKYGRIEAMFESISSKVFDSESLKSIMDGLANILEFVDKIVGKGQGLTLLGASIGGILGASGNGFVNAKTTFTFWKQAAADINHFNSIQSAGVKAQREFALSIQETNAGLSTYLTKQAGANASIRGYISGVIGATAKTVGLRIAVTALNLTINGLISAGFALLISKINQAANSAKELREEFKSSTETIKNSIDDIEQYKKTISTISAYEKDEAESISKLNDLKDELSHKYKRDIDDINNVVDAKKNLIDVLNEEENVTRATYLADNLENFKKAVSEVSDNVVGDGLKKKSIIKQFTIGTEVSDEINKILGGGTLDGGLFFDLGRDGENELQYYNRLIEIVKQFDEYRGTHKLTKDEEDAYNIIIDKYSQLKKYLEDDGINYSETLYGFALQQAEQLVEYNPQLNRSLKEWRNHLVDLANEMDLGGGNSFVIEMIDEIIHKSSEATKSTNDINSPLSEVISNLSKIDSQTSDIASKIKEANTQFDDLAKIISDNKDADKLFSSSEIIEILEKYPSLNDAILESTYGYKIEQEALDNLRQAKLEEQKTALQTQLSETATLYDNTKKRLESYKSEIGSIKNVAEAKLELAKIEAQISSFDNLSAVNKIKSVQSGNYSDMLNKKKMIDDYISAQENLNGYEQTIKKLQTELNVLGNVFDDVKDSTNDQTTALNNQKSAIKDLDDEMKQAQDDINDLIELTMNMLKKQKELEKEALKEQLDNYKKLISAKKELLDIEKETYDFEKNLKEKNDDILKLQQEYDALNIEGANYSLEDLKRKAEIEEDLAEKKSSRDEFLYEHEIDVRKDALDKEQESFENQIETQTKEIEDYLDHEGRIRQDAIDLINSKSQSFYNDLLNYTMNYTTKSQYEFNKLWNDAYAAIEKYAGGQIDVDMALMVIIEKMALAEAQIKNIDNAVNNLKGTISGFVGDSINGWSEFNKVLNETPRILSEIGAPPTIKASDLKSTSSLMAANEKYAEWVLNAKNMKIPVHHNGGVVGGQTTNPHSEVLAKLLSGELVTNDMQAETFMTKTLPKLTENSITNNNASLSPVVNMGDIYIQGNADSNTVAQLKAERKSIVNDVFDVINRQRDIFNGGKIRGI